MWSRRDWLPWLFALYALPLCAWLAAFTPPGDAPDEPAHIYRADSVRRGEIIGRRIVVGGNVVSAGVTADPGLRGAIPSAAKVGPERRKPIAASEWARARAGAWVGPQDVLAPNTASYQPLFYIPGAVGLEAAELLGLPPFQALRLGRLVAAVVYVGIGALALALARRGRALILVTLCLPMSLHVGASFSQDGPLIATSLLGAALVSRARAGDRWFWAAAIVLAAAIMAKPPYLPLAALLLLPRGDLRLRLGVAALACVPALLWSGAVALHAAVPFYFPPYVAGPLSPGGPQTLTTTDPAVQVSILLAHPWLLASLPWDMLRLYGTGYIRQFIGILSELDVVLPSAAYAFCGAALGAALAWDLFSARTSAVATWLGRAACYLAVIGCVWLIALQQYVTWTEVGSLTVQGFQGRYALPLMAAVAAAMPSLPRSLDWRARAVLGGLVALGPIASLVWMPSALLQHFAPP